MGLAPLRTSAPAVPSASTTPRGPSPASQQYQAGIGSHGTGSPAPLWDHPAHVCSPTGSASGLARAQSNTQPQSDSQPPRTSAPAALAARPGLSPASAAPGHVGDRGSPVGANWYTRAGLSLEQLPDFPCTWEQQLVIMSRLPQPQYLHVRWVLRHRRVVWVEAKQMLPHYRRVVGIEVQHLFPGHRRMVGVEV
jgi:hypothetical protein